MKKITKLIRRWAFVVLNLLFLGLSVQSIAQAVNSTATITWPFDSGAAGQIATYSASTGTYFKPDYTTMGGNYVYNGKSTPNATTVTADPTLSGLTFTNIKCALASGNSPTGALPDNLLAFNLTPVTGLSFKPTSVSFKCLRFGTGSGLIDLYWKSNDGTITASTLIQANIKPGRDAAIVAGDNTTSVSIDLTSLNLPASTKECTLQVYIHSLGSAKSVGLSKVIVNGTVNGSISTVTSYNVTTSNAPSVGGSVATFPVGTTHDSGTSLTLTATRNFGYAFSHWENGTGQQLSTANPYTFTLNSNADIKAVYTPINTYPLNLTQTAGNSYMVVPTPVGTMVGGQRMYEDGTNVLIKANNNSIFNFSNWGTGETTSELTVKMDQARTVNAVYSTIDYVVGWDFYKAGGSGRVADFASKTDNAAAALVLRKADGTATGWLDKSMVANGGSSGRGAAINWKPIGDLYYYQISFNASDFVNMSVKAGMLYAYIAHSVQKMEYSLDGINFTTLGTYTLSSAQAWFDQTFSLPADANNKPIVYVRWIPDYTSAKVGVGTDLTSNDGTSLSDIYVFGSEAIVNDGVAPVLTSSVPANAAIGASSSGKIVLNFDEKIQLAVGTTATLGSKTLIPEVSGKTISFPYVALDYNANYTFTLSAGKVSDLSGNTKTTPITFSFTTLNKPTVTKKRYDFIVGVDGDFAAAKAAAIAAAPSGNRFIIFLPNGNYNLGLLTGDAKKETRLTVPNLSLIGQSMDKTILFNEPILADEGFEVSTINLSETANNVYMQDLTLLNKLSYRTGSYIGRGLALENVGNKNILKNVALLGNQDTFYTAGQKIYVENGEIHGTVDFIYGSSDAFFKECLLYLEDRTNNVITAGSSFANGWGFVFSDCTIDGFDVNKGGYSLGRPWNNAPKVVFINTKMTILPKAEGWSAWNTLPAIYAEYNSANATGGVVDLSNRKTNYTNGTGGSVTLNPILTPTQAATYTVENVLGADGWQPNLYTDQITAPIVAKSGATLTWADNNYVLGWAVIKDEVFVNFVTTNSYVIPNGTTTGKYTVRAANSMGGLGLVSNEINLATLGVNENKILDIKVYPNPVVNNQFFVSIPATVENATMELFGLDGKQLLKREVKNSIEEVNVSGMTSGVYLLKINSNNGTQVVKIVK